MSKKQKQTAKQRANKLEAARRREEEAKKREESKERMKRIFTFVIAVILVLALGLPTMALMVMGGGA